MDQRLTDIERTLLSAYLDGELSAAERQRAEGLLASSGAARSYLGDLRAVNSISGDAFPAAPADLLSGSLASKLSATAIKSAAAKSSLAHGIFSSGWGIGGMMSAAATIAIVVGVTMSGGDAPQPVIESSQPKVVTTTPVIPAANIDTSSLIVPQMTSSELMDFAVKGTLPIDSDRERYITVTPGVGDSISICVHDRSPAIANNVLQQFEMLPVRLLDSARQSARTALLQCGDKELAIRGDLPQIRLDLLRQIEGQMANLPEEVQNEIERARRELESISRRNSRFFVSSGTVRPATPSTPVPFIRVEVDPFRRWAVGGASGGDEDVVVFSAPVNERHMVVVNADRLDVLESFVARQTQSAEVTIVRDRKADVVDPTGGTPQPKRPRIMVANGSPYGVSATTRNSTPTPPAINGPSATEMEQMLHDAEEKLERAERAIRRVDTIIKLRRKKSLEQSNSNGGDTQPPNPSAPPDGNRSPSEDDGTGVE